MDGNTGENMGDNMGDNMDDSVGANTGDSARKTQFNLQLRDFGEQGKTP